MVFVGNARDDMEYVERRCAVGDAARQLADVLELPWLDNVVLVVVVGFAGGENVVSRRLEYCHAVNASQWLVGGSVEQSVGIGVGAKTAEYRHAFGYEVGVAS